MKRKTLKRLGFLTGVGLALWLWRQEQATGDISRRLKYIIIRGVQSARLVQGREHAFWVRWFYALLAPVYDFTFLNLPGYRQSADDLIEWMLVGADDVALDVGCGTGLLALPLAQRAARPVGLDLSQAMLEKLSGKAARQGLNIELRQGSVLQLPFNDGEFSLVTTAFMLLYLTPEEKQQAMAEIYRVLAPGGRLGCLSSQGEIAGVFLTREEWAALLTGAGFTNVQIKEQYDIFRLATACKEEVK